MILLDRFPIVRGLLLASMLAVSLAGCANDGRLDLKKLDFGKLNIRQPDWMHWDKAAPASPEAQTATTTSPQTPNPADPVADARPAAPQPATITPALAQGLPRPRPWRPVAAQPVIPRSAARQSQRAEISEIKEQPTKAPQGKVTSEIPQALAVLPSPAKPPRAQGKGGYSPDDLVGLDGPAVERLLGKPDLSRKEPFAEVWQYTHGDCVLFLFIYAEDGGAGRVSHAETGARDGGKNPEPGQCIGAILARNAAVPG